ncbi:LysR family transcriptional regulator [Vibrio vulnificus]|uniref:LysR family transcriptional regulator n=1 Tax=Vibrio vulnificus TaxID=672 RepID=UPI001A220DB8|nr:LysR substrate-binding domain-containing protein [Vibrio vulnificus]MCA3989404.1 LysR family transcriptional regulator [Vibrio vulnificus]HAS6172977.1 LysR family transcriptional regulator [Vibrio vulnificus]HAS6337298.1 LysR family transcriptional regulator [Vibrio vulnificus]HDY7599718.1 LysR family transcriptional regulator [Vibrio vulnificus]HDY7709451.1 LysR family transcriptional regulator [Vibrio vulnificus]
MLELLKVFDQVVESGSFSQAGRALNMAPSSVARNIDSLENRIKTTLFKRSTRQLILTEEGQYFYQQSSKILRDSDNLLAEMRGNHGVPEGILRISVFESFGNLCLTPLIPEFLERYPKIQIELELDNKLVDLNSDNVDMAIRIGTPQDSRLKARHLLTNYTALVASPAYINTHSPITQPEDLQQHNCLLISHERQRNYWYFRQKSITRKVMVAGNLISKGGSPLLCAALQGTGVLLLSKWMLKSYLESGQLVELLPSWTATHGELGSGEIFAIYKNTQYPKPHLRVFLDFLLEKLKPMQETFSSS